MKMPNNEEKKIVQCKTNAYDSNLTFEHCDDFILQAGKSLVEKPRLKEKESEEESNLKNIFIADRESYMKIAKEAVDKGFMTFSPSARLMYQRDVEEFLEFYKNNYDNEFAKNFEIITSLQVIQSKEEYFCKIHSIANGLKNENEEGIFILYRIINKSNQFIRIGYTSDIIQRLIIYLQNSFSKILKGITNIHLDIRALGDRNKFNDEFEYQIICVVGDEIEILALERLFTIYENRCDNDVGFDLSINSYYNKIVGDLFSYINGEFRNNLHPNWKDVPPDKLKKAFKECISWDKILNRFPRVDSKVTIMSKAVSYGFSLKGNGSIHDVIAYFIKPEIEEALKKNLNRDKIIKHLINRGFTFLKKLSSHPESRKKWLYRILNYIWKSEMSKIGYKTATLTRVRWLVIAKEALKLARNPKFNHIRKVQTDLLKQGIVLKPPNPPQYEGELRHILKKVKWSYKQEQNKIFAPTLAKYLRQNDPELSVSDIAELFGLDRVKGKRIISNMIYRIFKEHGENIGKIRQYLRTHLDY